MALSVKNVFITLGKKEILNDVSIGLSDGSKAGLIGRNGSGKTTFLKAILGQIDYSGSIAFDGKAVHFAQNTDLDLNKTVREAINETAQVHHQGDFEEEIKSIEKQMSDPAVYENHELLSKLSDRFVELQSKINDHESKIPNAKIKSILHLLEVPESWLGQKIAELSTGQRAIVSLARILSSDAEFLLLDEPTNHLDFKRLAILEHFLVSFKGTVLAVSHDRFFLDRVCDTIIKIENGKLLKFMGNYSQYKVSREGTYASQMTAFTQEKRYLAAEKDKIARIGKSPQKVSQGKYREKLLEKRELVERPDLDQTKFKTHFEASPIHGLIIVEAKDLTIGYDKPLLSNINFKVGKDQRVILIGDNGTGKSTLFKTIKGRVSPLSGKVLLDVKAKIGYADQELKDLTSNGSVYDEIFAMLDDLGETRRHLGMMGFKKDEEVYKPIANLSMGEKSRLNLLKILIEKPNLLLLDEPTNHLDIEAREILEEAFLNYDGAILAVSHDRFFIERIAERKLKVMDKTIKYVK
ncbi:MAG: ABC-F family ATP-binding cassette domain-containing protein [Candidatus Micrarchaeota archaeon]